MIWSISSLENPNLLMAMSSSDDEIAPLPSASKCLNSASAIASSLPAIFFVSRGTTASLNCSNVSSLTSSFPSENTRYRISSISEEEKPKELRPISSSMCEIPLLPSLSIIMKIVLASFSRSASPPEMTLIGPSDGSWWMRFSFALPLPQHLFLNTTLQMNHRTSRSTTTPHTATRMYMMRSTVLLEAGAGIGVAWITWASTDSTRAFVRPALWS
mmetsp:Transcript_11533/g.26393  ORF Transcript_11533/g.26393 Transcript_11533/m.26393 type:complete len:215 (+) Transcript_11533:1046-1690(+)